MHRLYTDICEVHVIYSQILLHLYRKQLWAAEETIASQMLNYKFRLYQLFVHGYYISKIIFINLSVEIAQNHFKNKQKHCTYCYWFGGKNKHD